MSQQPTHHGPSSSIDQPGTSTTENNNNSNNSTPAAATGTDKLIHPRLDRPKSSPSSASNFFQSHKPTLSSSSSSTAASSTTTSTGINPRRRTGVGAGSGSGTGKGTGARARRPPNAVLPGVSRPKTAYQAVTWKENLDAFNRRLRRGSLSLDAAAQEEEQQLLASLTQPQQVLVTQQHQQQEQHLDQAATTASRAGAGTGVGAGSYLDEHAQLLGNPAPSAVEHTPFKSYNNGHTVGGGAATYGATSATVGGFVPVSSGHGGGRGRSNQEFDRSSDPVFPMRLNPVLVTTKSSSKLGVFSGVFVPCLLSIWGIILFLRFGFIIGQAGVMGTMAMFIVGYAINIFTTLSLSAISTNGTVRGGGVYYLVSRSLGPEFGGSIGLIYFLCTVVGCGMNVLGFVEPLISNFGESSGTVYRILPESQLWGFIYGTILLVSCTLVCLVGSKLFARSSLVLAVIILLSTLSIFVSFALMPPFTHPERNIEYTGFSWDTLQENMWPRFTTTNGPEGTKQSFQTVFGVLFPACIGILAGASMSGDLEDPSKSIPKGTLWAVGSTFCVYTFIIVLMGGSISRSTMYTDLSVLQDVSISPLFIASGALAASVFATLGCVIGAAKILQAIARDNLLPLLSVFGQGTPKTDEPTLAVLVTYILCQLCLFLTDMNAIATFVSLITLLTYLILNLACFLLKIGSAPNFRPSFRFFHWWTAFGGMILCALVMGFVDLGQSLLSGLMTAVLFIWIHYWSPPKRWGDVTQSLIYHQVRKYLLRLDSRKEHVKFWRPQILLLVHHPRSEYHLIQFCNHLKKGALYVLGHVILGDLRDVLQEYRRQQGSWLKFVDVLQIKAFVNLSVADSVRIGARNLLIGTGLGGMRPNIVVLGSFNLQRYLREKQEAQQQQQIAPGPHQHPHSPSLKKGAFASVGTNVMNNSHTDHTLLNIPVNLPIDNMRVESPIKITDYVSIIEDVLSLNKAVAIGYGFERLDLPEEHKTSWKQMFDSSVAAFLPPSLFSSSSLSVSSRASSLRKFGASKKKKYIDLWPMQMSIAPLQCNDPTQQASSSYHGHKRTSRDVSSSSPMMPGGGATFSESFSQGAAAAATGGPNVNRTTEPNLTNFDTYAMVLQMGCILHMVPQWKDNYLLRVMVFVEYEEDVEEERKRLHALLENLRIPAEVNVMCLDGGDSETYERLVKRHNQQLGRSAEDGFFADEYRSRPIALGSDEEESEQYQHQDQGPITAAPVAQRPGPRNINPHWQHHAPLAEEDEDEDEDERRDDFRIQGDGHNSSHETGPYSNVADHHTKSRENSSSSTASATKLTVTRSPYGPVFQASAPPPQRRRTISHTDRPGQPQRPHTQSPSTLRVNTALSPHLRQRSPIAVSSAHPLTSQYPFYNNGVSGIRYRNAMAGSTSPMDSRLGTSVPLGASMNFRIALPLPRQYFDPNGGNSSSDSESDSISSEDDEDYDHNNDDLVYGGGAGLYPPQLQQQSQRMLQQHLSPTAQRLYQQQQQQQLQSGSYRSPPLGLPYPPTPRQQPQQPQHSQHASTEQPSSTFDHTSLGSELQPTQQQHAQGLGIALGATVKRDSEQDTIDQTPYPQHSLHPFSTSTSSNPWASIGPTHDSGDFKINDSNLDIGTSTGVYEEVSIPYAMSPPEETPFGILSSSSVTGALGLGSAGASPQMASSIGFGREDSAQWTPQGPIQFDHLGPEAQLMILNELMRIHSSAETTSIVFTTVPAPEAGTCLSEESSAAYLEQLDLLMDGIDIPVLLLHAKSLTVTMTL